MALSSVRFWRLHSKIKNKIRYSRIFIIVGALYPTILIEHNLYPAHLGPKFLEVYRKIKEERVAAKRAKEKLKDATLKLSINGLSGNLQSDYSWCCDYNVAYTMRINGQLMMMMLLEILDEEGCKICQSNTDGILYIMSIYFLKIVLSRKENFYKNVILKLRL